MWNSLSINNREKKKFAYWNLNVILNWNYFSTASHQVQILYHTHPWHTAIIKYHLLSVLRSYCWKTDSQRKQKDWWGSSSSSRLFQSDASSRDLLLVLVMWPKLLQVINNFQKWESYLSVNTFKNYSNVLWALLKKIITYLCLVTENEGQLAGEKMLQEGHNYKKTKDFAICSIPNHGTEFREGVPPSSVELCNSCFWNQLLHIACYKLLSHNTFLSDFCHLYDFPLCSHSMCNIRLPGSRSCCPYFGNAVWDVRYRRRPINSIQCLKGKERRKGVQDALQHWTDPQASSLAGLQTTFQPRAEHKSSLEYFKVKSNWCGTAASQQTVSTWVPSRGLTSLQLLRRAGWAALVAQSSAGTVPFRAAPNLLGGPWGSWKPLTDSCCWFSSVLNTPAYSRQKQHQHHRLIFVIIDLPQARSISISARAGKMQHLPVVGWAQGSLPLHTETP